MLDITDESLVAQVKSGDRDKYELLVERYESKLNHYATRFLSDNDAATDAVQDVFIKAYINIQSFDTSKKFSSWIYRIAHNEFVNILRKKKSLSVSFFDFDTFFPHQVEGEGSDMLALKREDKERVEKAISKLEPKYREPIVLYYFEDMKYDEIADVLLIPVATVGVRIMRAKKLLEKII
ncbi:MAG: polymerase sigma factor SigW, polymerase sigma-70 factor, subfamily [Candidatus Nomurabacteria bacterium]|nr:polymerase sigma factor SigW, polymerase sigma-70 factor, subfamily [Candidatus Nomurabacteria bacterium]